MFDMKQYLSLIKTMPTIRNHHANLSLCNVGLVARVASGGIIFEDTFGSSTGWTLTGSAAITGGKLETGTFGNVAPVAIKSITDLGSGNFTVDFDFKMNSDGTTNNDSMFFALSNHDDTRSSGGSGDAIICVMHNLNGQLRIFYKIDTSTVSAGTQSAAGLSLGTQYYMTLNRTGNTITLTAYSDSGRTTSVTSCTATVTSSLNVLNRICIGASEATPSNGSANCTIDNIKITLN